MLINLSIVLSAIVPSARGSADSFTQAVDILRGHGVNTIEYASPLDEAFRRGKILAERSMRGIFLAASYQKENKQNLSSVNRGERSHALAECERYIDAAIASGAAGLLITSGRFPDNQEDERDAWAALEDSLRFLIERSKGQVRLLLEPGDRTVDARQLAGPTDKVVAMMRRLNQPLDVIGLAMDTSHLAQLYEDALDSLALSEPYCDHVHLANCILKPDSPLYGDKHPLFNHEGAVYTDSDLENIYRHLREKSIHQELTVALEVISRDPDPWRVFHQVIRDEAWFFHQAE